LQLAKLTKVRHKKRCVNFILLCDFLEMFVPKYPQSYLNSQNTKPFHANIQIKWMWKCFFFKISLKSPVMYRLFTCSSILLLI
jgi:hypothetical protein